MNPNKMIKVGIGFATGRKSFKRVLRTYIYNFKESGLVENEKINLNIFIAYDLRYKKTKATDYTSIHRDLYEQIDNFVFIGNKEIEEDIAFLKKENVLDEREARMIFGRGYASKRNTLLYNAIKDKMDYLIFLDDDEYPLAVTNAHKSVIWSGQQVLSTHLEAIPYADITHGSHCGYISPIPTLNFNENMTESDFKAFIEAISNDIVSWETLKDLMNNGGVTYADTKILARDISFEVETVNHTKFISGANLCINLTDPRRVFPFYNPPNARGEDTFLSTCLGDRRVVRVPVYTFHDGFSTYNRLLEGVLPIKLQHIRPDNEQIITRFYNACIGWIRYKPLLLRITQPDAYDDKIIEMREKLTVTLPKVCAYFDKPEFTNILDEMEKYHKNVAKHAWEFQETKRIWEKVMAYFSA